MRILVADDSKYQRFCVTSILVELGECREAVNGEEAVRLYREGLDAGEPFTLVIMDILMPLMDGHEALKRIRKLEEERNIPEASRTKALMLSNLDDPKNMVEAQYHSGANAYLTKPFEEQTLKQSLINLGLRNIPFEMPDATPGGDDDEDDDEGPCIVL